MKVYESKCIGGYAGGSILVAANSEEEALQVLASDDDYNYVCEWNEDYTAIDRMSDNFTPFRLFECLEYDAIRPCVILFSFYFE